MSDQEDFAWEGYCNCVCESGGRLWHVVVWGLDQQRGVWGSCRKQLLKPTSGSMMITVAVAVVAAAVVRGVAVLMAKIGGETVITSGRACLATSCMTRMCFLPWHHHPSPSLIKGGLDIHKGAPCRLKPFKRQDSSQGTRYVEDVFCCRPTTIFLVVPSQTSDMCTSAYLRR